jgi:hypothetical protein
MDIDPLTVEFLSIVRGRPAEVGEVQLGSSCPIRAKRRGRSKKKRKKKRNAKGPNTRGLRCLCTGCRRQSFHTRVELARAGRVRCSRCGGNVVESRFAT